MPMQEISWHKMVLLITHESTHRHLRANLRQTHDTISPLSRTMLLWLRIVGHAG